MDDRQIIAHNIKLLRDASGFTQDMIANYLGINRSTYSNYESGDRELPFLLMEKLADMYGCDLYDFYSQDETKLTGMLATAFRVDSLSPEDLAQVAAFKRIVRNSLKMDQLLGK